jgi:hypothetical protein
MMRVIFFLLREEQAVEIELGEIEENATASIISQCALICSHFLSSFL